MSGHADLSLMFALDGRQDVAAILCHILNEHDRAIALHPYSVSLPDGTGAGMYAQQLAIARLAYDRAKREGRLTHGIITEEEFLEVMCETDLEKLDKELVQLGAMALKWIIDLRRRRAVEACPRAGEVTP